MDTINVEYFINEVENRPVIWNMECSDYSDRNKKKSAWEEITTLFGGEGLSEEEQIQLHLRLQEKWKNMRDCFFRELRKQKDTRSGSATTPRVQYVFFSDLQFLKNVANTNNTQSSFAEEDVAEEFEDGPQPFGKEGNPHKRRWKNSDVDDSTIMDMLRRSIQMQEEREDLSADEDRMFLLSLVSELKKVPEYKKFALKTNIMSLIRSAQLSPPQPVPPAYTSRGEQNLYRPYDRILGYRHAYDSNAPGPSQLLATQMLSPPHKLYDNTDSDSTDKHCCRNRLHK